MGNFSNFASLRDLLHFASRASAAQPPWWRRLARGAAEAGLAPARRIEIDDVKRLFAQQKVTSVLLLAGASPRADWSDATPRGLACRVSKKFSTPTADIARPILLALLPSQLDFDELASFCEKIMQCKGTTLFTGIGKSAYIAKKVPDARLHRHAFHVARSADALHGDIGVLSRGDILVMLSKSGETEESRSSPTPRRRVPSS